MTTRPLFSVLGFTIAIFSMSAISQVNYGNAPSPGTPSAAPAAATAPAPQTPAAATTTPAPEPTAAAATAPTPEASSATTTEPANKKHTGKMHARLAHPETPTTAASPAPTVAMSGTGDPAYRAALKQCIAGPEAQRDSCLDDAIARYSHS